MCNVLYRKLTFMEETRDPISMCTLRAIDKETYKQITLFLAFSLVLESKKRECYLIPKP